MTNEQLHNLYAQIGELYVQNKLLAKRVEELKEERDALKAKVESQLRKAPELVLDAEHLQAIKDIIRGGKAPCTDGNVTYSISPEKLVDAMLRYKENRSATNDV